MGFNRDYNCGLPTTIIVYGKIVIHGKSHHSFGAGCSVLVKKGAVLEIGNNFGCTGDTRVWVHKKVTIGENNLWSFGCTVMDGDDHKIYDEDHNLLNDDKPIAFGDNIWMGCNCTILKGVTIPSNCIIAAGSMITAGKIIEGERKIISSNGKVLRDNVVWCH